MTSVTKVIVPEGRAPLETWLAFKIGSEISRPGSKAATSRQRPPVAVAGGGQRDARRRGQRRRRRADAGVPLPPGNLVRSPDAAGAQRPAVLRVLDGLPQHTYLDYSVTNLLATVVLATAFG